MFTLMDMLTAKRDRGVMGIGNRGGYGPTTTGIGGPVRPMQGGGIQFAPNFGTLAALLGGPRRTAMMRQQPAPKQQPQAQGPSDQLKAAQEETQGSQHGYYGFMDPFYK
jgi:hypothetical protein